MYATTSKDYAKAEQSLISALHEAERFGADDLRVGSTQNTLGLVYAQESKFKEAETAYQKALAGLGEGVWRGEHRRRQREFQHRNRHVRRRTPGEALLAKKAQQVYEGQLGGTSLKTATVLCMEGDAWRALKDYSQAEGVLRRCADIRGSADGGVQNVDFGDDS